MRVYQIIDSGLADCDIAFDLHEGIFNAGSGCKGDSGGPMFAGRHRGCRAGDRGGEARPRILQGVISRYSTGGRIDAAIATMQEARACMSADTMVSEPLAETRTRRWIFRTTGDAARGCRT